MALAGPLVRLGSEPHFVASRTSPSGTTVPLPFLEQLAQEVSGPLVIDEAYVDFADRSAISLLKHRNIIITRSLSKSHSLAGIRFGYALADAALVRELIKVKDSYNCDVLSLAAAAAVLEDREYLHGSAAGSCTRGREWPHHWPSWDSMFAPARRTSSGAGERIAP